MDKDRIAPIFKGQHILVTGGEELIKQLSPFDISLVSLRNGIYGQSVGWQAVAGNRSRKDLHVDAREERNKSKATFGHRFKQSGKLKFFISIKLWLFNLLMTE